MTQDHTYFPGTRVVVNDTRLYKNDKDTPPDVTRKTATVIRWYGTFDIPPYEYRHKIPESHGGLPLKKVKKIWRYPSLIDVKFDYDGGICCGKLAEPIYVEVIK